MSSDINTVYELWKEKWELSHPQPRDEAKDLILNVLKYTMAIGAVVLSGSRTGSVVASIGALSSFAEKLGVSSSLVTASEALLAFLTFDAAILLAGYALNVNADKRWYYILLITAAAPALAANVSPSFKMFGENTLFVANLVVDIIVGVCTPAIAFVAGRVIGVTNKAEIKRRENVYSEWLDKKNAAWVRSREYRDWNKASNPVSIVERIATDRQPMKNLITALLEEKKTMDIGDIAVSLKVPEQDVWSYVLTMTNVARSGSSVQLTDF